jgi:predicted nucleic acid-binding protein
MKPTVYIETTIISYLTARPSRDLVVAGHQQVTADWWEDVRPQVECFVSPFVIQEASRGESAMAAKRLEAISEFSVLAENETIDELAQRYFKKMSLPGRARIDAFHVATATAYEMDYLLSWNCRHIASAHVQRTIQRLNDELGIQTPVMCTPEALMEV